MNLNDINEQLNKINIFIDKLKEYRLSKNKKPQNIESNSLFIHGEPLNYQSNKYVPKYDIHDTEPNRDIMDLDDEYSQMLNQVMQ